MAELLGVEVVGVSAHEAIDAQLAHDVEELLALLVNHFVIVDEALALAAIEWVRRVAIYHYPTEVRAGQGHAQKVKGGQIVYL